MSKGIEFVASVDEESLSELVFYFVLGAVRLIASSRATLGLFRIVPG
jgi:hypothetical protein